MTTATGATTKPATSTPRFCPDCGHPTRIHYVMGGDIVVPGRWTCTHCPTGQAWPASKDYRCP